MSDGSSAVMDKASAFLQGLATNQAELRRTAGNMLNLSNDASSQLSAMEGDIAQQWAELGLVFDESGERVEVVAALQRYCKFDESMLGPALKQRNSEGQAQELSRILLSREQDFTEALVHVGRDDFLGEPLGNAERNASLVGAVAANVYTASRDLFVSLGGAVASGHATHYRRLVTCCRSLCFLSRLLTENLVGVEERVTHLEVLRDKYDATIFTLRRQLMDFHRVAGTVGRGPNGEYQPLAANASAANVPPALLSPHSLALQGTVADNLSAAPGSPQKHATKQVVVVVQVEQISHLRARHPQLCDTIGRVARDVIVNFAHVFDLRRTNYTELGNANRAMPSSYLFVGEDIFQALAFTSELHVELNRSADWPAPLLHMARYGSSDLWRGLRVRIGVHYGAVAEMDVPEATAVMHVEGVQVEKCMRITALGAAGDTVVSTKAWDKYMLELTNGVVPTGRRYLCLRSLKSQELPCIKKRGFKKNEKCIRLWSEALKDRMDSTCEAAEFDIVSFFGLEAGDKVDDAADDDPPTAEELMFAKDTEISLLQQELDSVRLAMMKRESDFEEIKMQLLSVLRQVEQRTAVKTFYHVSLTESLESQLMQAHDALSKCEDAVSALVGAARISQDGGAVSEAGGGEQPPSASSGLSATSGQVIPSSSSSLISPPDLLADCDERRARRYSEFLEASRDDRAGASINPIPSEFSVLVVPPPSNDGGAGGVGESAKGPPTKHKNLNLWRHLNQIVESAALRLGNGKKPGSTSAAASSLLRSPSTLSPQGLHRIQSSVRHGTFPQVARFHRLLRVFTSLVKRFMVTEDAPRDSDNQSINEEQFIVLFTKLIHPEGVPGNLREYIQLMAQSALENEAQEAANQEDEARLLRSGAGLMSRLFLWLRQIKFKAALDSKAKAAAEQAAQEKGTGKKDSTGTKSSTTASKAKASAGGASPSTKRLSLSPEPNVAMRRTSRSPTTTPPPLSLDGASGTTPRSPSLTALDKGGASVPFEEYQKVKAELARMKCMLASANATAAAASTSPGPGRQGTKHVATAAAAAATSAGGGSGSAQRRASSLSPQSEALVAAAAAFAYHSGGGDEDDRDDGPGVLTPTRDPQLSATVALGRSDEGDDGDDGVARTPVFNDRPLPQTKAFFDTGGDPTIEGGHHSFSENPVHQPLASPSAIGSTMFKPKGAAAANGGGSSSSLLAGAESALLSSASAPQIGGAPAKSGQFHDSALSLTASIPSASRLYATNSASLFVSNASPTRYDAGSGGDSTTGGRSVLRQTTSPTRGDPPARQSPLHTTSRQDDRDGIASQSMFIVSLAKLGHAPAAAGSASAMVRAHRAVPFTADKTLKVGGTAASGVHIAGASTNAVTTAAMAGSARGSPPPLPTDSSHISATHPIGDGISLGVKSLQPPRPVLQPLKHIGPTTSHGARTSSPTPPLTLTTAATSGAATAASVPSGAGGGASSSPPPEVGGRRVAGAPTGMTFPVAPATASSSLDGKGGKLFFAFNARDVQRQLEADEDERRALAIQQQRIQEQLVYLRQLQAENQALMHAAASNNNSGRPGLGGGSSEPTVVVAAATVPGGRPGGAMPAASRPVPMGVSKMSILGHVHLHSAPRNPPSAAGSKPAGNSAHAGLTLTVRSVGHIGAPASGLSKPESTEPRVTATAACTSPERGDGGDSPAPDPDELESAGIAIDVPSASTAKSQLVAQIVAQHRLR